MSENRLLIVEDDQSIRLTLNRFLSKNGFDVMEAEDGEQALKLAPGYRPDVILLDANMPNKDGYATCRELKSLPDTSDIPVIFVSGNITTEERVRGYDAGGDDYLTKPVDYDVLLIKIEKLQAYHSERKNLAHQLSESSQVALNAMSYTSNMGAIVQFLETSLDCHTLDSLAELVLITTSSFGLDCCMQIVKGEARFNYGIPAGASPIEAQIMSSVKEAGRFFDYGPKSVIRFKHFVLLVKNMPVDNEATYGSIKDVLAALGNAADARIKSIYLNEKLTRQRVELLDTLKKVLSIVKVQYSNMSGEFMEAADDMVKETEEALHELGLMEYQEQNVLEISHKYYQRVQASLEKGLEMDKYFDRIRDVLDRSYKDITEDT